MSLASLAGAPDSGLFHQAQDLLSCGLLNHRGRGRWQGAGGAGTSAVSDFVRFIGSAAAGRGCHGCLCDKGQKYGPCHSLLPIFLWLWSHGGWEALAVCTSSSPAPGFSGLWAQLLWLVFLVLPPLFVLVHPFLDVQIMWNAPAPWCVEQRHLC